MIVRSLELESLYENPTVIEAIERLNSVGLKTILDEAVLAPLAGAMTLSIARPSGRQREPLGNFDDGAIVSPNGYANGHFSQILVMNRLIAEVAGLPVIGTPTPSREQGAFHNFSPARYWYGKDPHNKLVASVGVFENFASTALERVSRYAKDARTEINKLHAVGGSLGAPLSLALLNRARGNFDIGTASLYALPNTQTRTVYGELLIRDFARSANLEPGYRGHTMAGSPRYEPLFQSLGFGDAIPHRRATDVRMVLNYFFRDMLGGADLSNFKGNEAFSRALSVPSAFSMIERLLLPNTVQSMHLMFFGEDPVAPPPDDETWRKSGISPLAGLEVEIINRVDHAACQNPYVVGHAAFITKR